MKGQKDIFDHIRDNQDKLDERPRRELWDRLENRLDEAEQKPVPIRKTWYQRLSLVAAVLLLAGMFSMVSLLLNNKHSQNTSEAIASPSQWEDFSAYTASNDEGWYKYAGRLNKRPPIREGARTKKLVAQKHFPEDVHYAQVQFKAEEATQLANHLSETNSNAMVANNASVLNKEMEMSEAETTEEAIVLYDATEADMTTTVASPVASSSTPPTAFSSSPIAENVNANEAIEEQVSAKLKTKAKSEMARKAKRAPAKKRMAKDMAFDTNGAANADVVAVSLNQFQWLLGQWEGQKNKEQSIETWMMTDQSTIEGKGTLLVDGQIVFTEGMSIKKIGSDLFYLLTLDDRGTRVSYKLKTYTAQEAVFENTQVAFPNQVILRRNEASNYSTILQNKASAEINDVQQSYFSNRNVIRQEQVERVMQRTDK